MAQFSSILDFWLGTTDITEPPTEKAQAQWFAGGQELDTQIAEDFKSLVNAAASGKFEDWQEQSDSCMALLILLDQFSRNIWRDSAKAFANDAHALEIANDAISRKLDREVHLLSRPMFYLPLMHAEDLRTQNRCVKLYEKLVDSAPRKIQKPLKHSLKFAIAHQKVIRQFGRFPSRNSALGRSTTPDEQTYLDANGGF